ncbi:MAG: O-acetylhomoserine aminocarboxypropyltransferase/cysteine synthase [Firmicutes bacterium]|jgi:O-acetylhomoserine (thiol)-lyase|uniref:O-acetylhomoserine aminocarboxypropyltransferase n=1 Tax=Sulfobacillus benefaciens TaxID=453960 RepID=A0A2T2WQ74_9FIRM|nr:O-acetylhomoserine aminocarboxypropyltransferase/cysteine synthase [Bacillota bacterium]MCL5015220.1 O-acetylhomoserine aminocarboxypropyltransferase/cysteine synthase [Bacillota bacterium]PSR24384.1 MAG: O-acetylhomoserine aminocarboxypropyltransferase [Sulfobacillus benefaciens]
MDNNEWAIETLSIRAGYQPDVGTSAIAAPIYQTVGYAFQDTSHAARLFNLDEPGNIYTRIMNPTTDVLEKRIAAMEGGVGAVAFSSGMAAITAAVLNLCRAGDELIASTALYGGTWTLFTSTMVDFGVTVHFITEAQLDEAEALINERTRGVFVESIGNPALNVTDMKAWAAFAHRHQLPLLVDNTFPTPYLERPLDHGADIVIHSMTKWIGGHGTTLGGIVVDGGHFDYNTDKFPQFSQPDQSYHGLVFGEQPACYALRLRVKLLRDTGAALSPLSAFLMLVGLETLPVRMKAACESALFLAQKLQKHPKVSWVNYPGLEQSPSHGLAKIYLRPAHFGTMLNFGVVGGRENAERVINRLKLWLLVANVGDVRSMAIHPASTTHQQLSPDEQQLAGAGGDLVRLSVGLENAEDLWRDLEQALESTDPD